ncbi:MAG: RICIN domain-containing protein, partial [Ruminococcus sp.]
GKQAVVLHSTSQSKTETPGVTNGGVYRLRNAGSGLYLTVANGMDADGTNLIQDTANGTASQKFRISYDTSSNTYRLYAMCSSDGTNRVVDIVKLGGGIASGCNVEIYRPVDAPAQTFVLSPQSDGTMLLSCSANRSACLSVWNQATGSNYDTGFYASGNVVIRNDIGDDLQRWILEPVS